MARKPSKKSPSCHGGKREGAGRPTKNPKTKAIRVPIEFLETISTLVTTSNTSSNPEEYSLPLYGSKVSAGYGNDANTDIEGRIHIAKYLVPNPSTTFCVRVSGDSMINAAIADGDLVIVDRSLEPTHNAIVIANLDSEFFVKRLSLKMSEPKLISENSSYPDLLLDGHDIEILGVVIGIVRKLPNS